MTQPSHLLPLALAAIATVGANAGTCHDAATLNPALLSAGTGELQRLLRLHGTDLPRTPEGMPRR